MKTINSTRLNRRSFVQASALAALIPYGVLSAAQQQMAPSLWHGIGPVSSDGTMFVVGNKFKTGAASDSHNRLGLRTHSTNAVVVFSIHGHDIQADVQNLSQQINLQAITVIDPGNSAVAGFTDLAHGFDQQRIATDLESLMSLCCDQNNLPVKLCIGVGTGNGENAGSFALNAAMATVEAAQSDQSAAGSLFIVIAANSRTLKLSMVKAVCQQLKTSAFGQVSDALTIASDNQMRDQWVRVTVVARQ